MPSFINLESVPEAEYDPCARGSCIYRSWDPNSLQSELTCLRSSGHRLRCTLLIFITYLANFEILPAFTLRQNQGFDNAFAKVAGNLCSHTSA
jgi:hypothetical protein